jgi:hypothetical protein
MNDAGTQEAVAKEVSDRLAKATSELQEKYARGQGGVEESVSAPTGTAYKEQHAKQEKDKAEKRQMKAAAQKQQNQVAASEMDVGDIDEDEVEDEEDFELRRIKEARLRQIKSAHNQMLENIGKGHGQFRDIVQDEFIGQVTSSNVVICHFYHKDFQKCRVMDHHLAKLAPRHIESKFIKIDAEKAPFFVEKVSILPVPCNFAALRPVALFWCNNRAYVCCLSARCSCLSAPCPPW